MHVPTRNVNNIAIDPTDEIYFAAGGSTDDPSVTVWDRRWLNQSTATVDTAAMLNLKAATSASARTSLWSVRFSGHKRGQLAMCSSIGELKLVNVADNHVSSFAKQDYYAANSLSGQTWSSGSYVTSSRELQHPVTDDLRGEAYLARVVSFDWLHNMSADDVPSIIALRANKAIEEIPCAAPVAVSFNARCSFTAVSTRVDITQPPNLQFNSQINAKSTTLEGSAEQTLADDKASVILGVTQVSALRKILEAGRVSQDRCRQGYLFDCKRNGELVSDSPALVQLWSTVAQLRLLSAEDGMVYDSVDLAFVGVHGIWSEIFGTSPQRRLSPSPTKPSDAIQGLIEKKEIPPFEGERTDYAEHRQLCLAVCGWKFTPNALEDECQEFIERGLYYQAVIQAVLHGAKHLALNLLRSLIRSKTIPNIGLGALLAADKLNDDQREMTRWMAADTDDSALKALLTYLESGDWRDVMKTPYLNLGYRLALGLKYLNDTELNGFIQSETARALKNGDPEGVLLTGLAEQSMDLFQRYITRSGDVQTAVLATAFTNPLYVDDPRWEMWKESYFLDMQAWQAFAERTRFVVEHNRLARTREGRCLVTPTAVQAKLHCVHCRSAIRRPTHLESTKVLKTPSANAGIVCLSCGKNLPRCSVCTLWLGTPDPHRYKPAIPTDHGKLSGLLSEKMLVFCTKCGHGSHAGHAQEWFAKFNVCPSPSCGCTCSNQVVEHGNSLSDLFKSM